MIGIIGVGNVGKALGRAFSSRGKSVIYGVNNPAKYQEFVAELGTKVQLCSVLEAITETEIVILAVPHQAARDIAMMIPDWKNRIIVDVTTPLTADYSDLSIGHSSSGAEEIAKLAHNARVVKAFSTMSAESMENPHFPQGTVFMPICADDDDAKQQVIHLANLLGFDSVDAGSLKAARYIEPLGMLWVHLAIKLGYGRDLEFGLLRR